MSEKSFTGNALDIISFLMTEDKKVLWDIELHKEKEKKRSLSSNAYYWRLLSQVARVLKVSNNFVHNTLLREVSVPFVIDGQLVRVTLPDTEVVENNTLEAMTYHLKPTSQTWVGADNVTYRTYIMLKGSSEFSVKEMHVLVDRLIEKAKELDIEVLSDDELEHIRALELGREVKKDEINSN